MASANLHFILLEAKKLFTLNTCSHSLLRVLITTPLSGYGILNILFHNMDMAHCCTHPYHLWVMAIHGRNGTANLSILLDNIQSSLGTVQFANFYASTSNEGKTETIIIVIIWRRENISGISWGRAFARAFYSGVAGGRERGSTANNKYCWY